MASRNVYNNSWPARGHSTPALHATTQAALDAGILYKGIVFMADGALDIVDAQGNKETITMPSGAVYPVQNYGAVTGGGTTLTTNQFACLFD